MKTLFALAITLGWFFKGTAQPVQYVTLNSFGKSSGVNFSVQTNQIISLVGYDWGFRPIVTGNFADGTSISLNPYNFTSSSASVVSQIPQIFTGLTNLNVNYNGGSNPSWATFQITTPSIGNVVSNYVPADAIVIPASATGDVQIILESSTDLVNWTAANPGTYGASSATNRFFRVRAIHN